MTNQVVNDPENLTPAASSSAAVKTARGRAEAKEPILLKVRLADVMGLHPAIEALQTELNILPIKRPMHRITQDPSFVFALRRNPIWVIRIRGKLRCVGNFNTWESSLLVFTEYSSIHCIEVFDITEERIKRNYLSELLYTPALFGIHFSELSKLAEIARRANDSGLWAPPLLKKSKASASDVNKYMAKVYGVDVRKLKSKAAGPVVPIFYDDDELLDSI